MKILVEEVTVKTVEVEVPDCLNKNEAWDYAVDVAQSEGFCNVMPDSVDYRCIDPKTGNPLCD